jgi:hypothetical protein
VRAWTQAPILAQTFTIGNVLGGGELDVITDVSKEEQRRESH